MLNVDFCESIYNTVIYCQHSVYETQQWWHASCQDTKYIHDSQHTLLIWEIKFSRSNSQIQENFSNSRNSLEFLKFKIKFKRSNLLDLLTYRGLCTIKTPYKCFSLKNTCLQKEHLCKQADILDIVWIWEWTWYDVTQENICISHLHTWHKHQ